LIESWEEHQMREAGLRWTVLLSREMILMESTLSEAEVVE